ncbi:hypothetical protein VNO78_32302 [Psophocarpus tetragonolobus]|uniref:Uncharacterized protein n=1 Tax=Psophocarpus tetragonolobus TaxID=3891 RepID=A0AAN9P0R8_PSOTE
MDVGRAIMKMVCWGRNVTSYIDFLSFKKPSKLNLFMQRDIFKLKWTLQDHGINVKIGGEGVKKKVFGELLDGEDVNGKCVAFEVVEWECKEDVMDGDNGGV